MVAVSCPHAPTQIRPPPLPEQRAIAEVLSALDAELAARRAKLARVKAEIMEVLLTGRVRLVENYST